MKKLRNDKRKDSDKKGTEEQVIELKETFQKGSGIEEVPSNVEQQQNNPGPTNEINLTVHVDMNEKIAESKKDNTVGLGTTTGRFQKAFQTPQLNSPIRSAPRDILGIEPPLYDQNLMHDYHDHLNGIFQNQNAARDYPVLNMYPNRNMVKSMISPVPVFSDPILNSRLIEKYIKNNEETTQEKNDFQVDDRADAGKYPIKNESARPSLFPNSVQKLATLNQNSTTEKLQQPIMENAMKLEYDFPEVQGADNERIITNITSKQQSVINSKTSDTLDSIQGDSNISGDFSHRKEVPEKSELRDLLIDIKSIVGSIAPLVNNNLDVTPSNIRNVTNVDKAKIQTTPIIIKKKETQANELDDHNVLNILNSTMLEKLHTYRDSDELNENNLTKMEKSQSEEQYKEVIDINHLTKEQMNLQSTKVNEPTKLHETKSTETSTEVTTPINKNKVRRNRIRNLDSADFIRTLRNLNIISDREISMLHRMAPRWKKKTNKINVMFKQLMQRKYFRNNLEHLLDIASIENGDDDENFNTNLIIALIELEEHLNHTTATIPVLENTPL